MSQNRVRFAPSPTGPLHMGGVRTALFNYLFAKKENARLVLRIEDTDQTRYVPGAEEYIMEALDWCRIRFDEGIREGGDYGPYRQSERKDIYPKYVNQLLENAWAYIAFDTPEELDALRKEAEAEKSVFKYSAENRNNLCNSLRLGEEETQKLIKAGRPYVVRFKVPENEMIEAVDLIRGNVKVNSSEVDDKVLVKTDGLPTYHLANIVDDHLMQITHVIRGEEWLPSLPLHILLYKAFGWNIPKFAHLPLILKPGGKGKLSKRDGDKLGFPVFPIEWKAPDGEKARGYREDGYFPEAFINILALLGWNPGTEQELFRLEELIQAFSLKQVGKSGARFDPEKAKWFNHQYLRQKPDAEIADVFAGILKEKGIPSEKTYVTKICALLKERVNFVYELWDEAAFFFVPPSEYDQKFAKKAWKQDAPEIVDGMIETLSNLNDFSSENCEAAIKTWIETHELGFGKVMKLFRLALVGAGKGPHVFDILELLGKKESLRRLENLKTNFA